MVERPKPPGAVKSSGSRRGYADSVRLPPTPGSSSGGRLNLWVGQPSIFAEDKLIMEIRMGRLTHPNAWSQAPMWATSHLIGNVVLESVSDERVEVCSRFQMMELRRDTVRHFGGTYRHTLLRTAEGLRIGLQRVDLMNGQAVYDYVLQAWV